MILLNDIANNIDNINYSPTRKNYIYFISWGQNKSKNWNDKISKC